MSSAYLWWVVLHRYEQCLWSSSWQASLNLLPQHQGFLFWHLDISFNLVSHSLWVCRGCSGVACAGCEPSPDSPLDTADILAAVSCDTAFLSSDLPWHSLAKLWPPCTHPDVLTAMASLFSAQSLYLSNIPPLGISRSFPFWAYLCKFSRVRRQEDSLFVYSYDFWRKRTPTSSRCFSPRAKGSFPEPQSLAKAFWALHWNLLRAHMPQMFDRTLAP